MPYHQAFKQPRSRPAARAPKQRLNYPLSEFNGVDNANDPSSIDPNMSPDSLNTMLDSIGSIEIRNGDYPARKLRIKLKSGEVSKISHAFVDPAQK